MCVSWGHGFTDCPCVVDTDRGSSCYNVTVGIIEYGDCEQEPRVEEYRTPGRCYDCITNGFYWEERSIKPKFEFKVDPREKAKNKSPANPNQESYMNISVNNVSPDPSPKLANKYPIASHSEDIPMSSRIQGNSMESMESMDSMDDSTNHANANATETSYSVARRVRGLAFAGRLAELLEDIPTSNQSPDNPMDNSTNGATANGMENDSEDSELNIIDNPINKPLERVKGKLKPNPKRKVNKNGRGGAAPTTGVRRSYRIPKKTKRYEQ